MPKLILSSVVIFLFSLPVCAQTVEVEGNPSATQVKIVVAAQNASVCTVKVSEDVSLAPLVYDLDPALFSGAAAATVISGAGLSSKREILIGRRFAAKDLNGRWDSRALAADTQYFGEVSVCVTSAVTFNFRTGVPQSSGPDGYPLDSTAWGQTAFPEFDFTAMLKPVIDPRTGIKIYSANPASFSSNIVLPVISGFTQGGSGWTNFANIISYASAVATTGSTNTATLFINTSAYTIQSYTGGGNWPYDNVLDIGLEVYGSGSDASATNRTIRACLTVDSQTCYTDYVTLALPQTTDAVAGVIPSVYPQAYFGGWSKRLPRKNWPQGGYVTATAGVVTLTKNDEGTVIPGARGSTAYFNPEWASGMKIYIANSSASCTNNFCTLSSVTDGTHLVLMENLSVTENVYRAAGLGIILNKTNATGTINISTRFRVAPGLPHDVWTGGCSNVTKTSVDGIVGYPCVFPRVRQDAGGLYFIGVSTPVVRLISLFPNVGCSPCNVADSPNGSAIALGPTTPAFDPIDPSYMYVTMNTNSAGPALFKVHYTGDWSSLNIAYTANGANPPVTTEMSWQNMTRSETGHSISTQILANTTYNTTIFPALTGVLQAGYSNGLVFYTITTGGLQDLAGWIFAFTASTGDFYRAWPTFSGPTVQELKYCGLHAGSPIEDGGILTSCHLLNQANSAFWLGGPFRSTLTSVKKGISFSADTSLPWPPDSTYDQTCPGAFPNPDGSSGCVTFRTPDPCSITPHTGEAAIYPCSDGNTAHSMIDSWKVGDWFKDVGKDPDSEGLKVVQITDLGGGNKEIVAWRNAPSSYCCIVKTDCSPDSTAQMQHANGWSLYMAPAEACASGLTLLDSTANVAYPVNNMATRGHFGILKTANKQITLTGIGDESLGTVYRIQYQRSWPSILQPADWYVPINPCFSGSGCSVFQTQSYVDAKQVNANADIKRFVFDFRHYNGNTGAELEYPNQTIGTAIAATLQGGTTSVYKITPTGTVDTKRGALTVWAGDTLLRDISSATTGNQITDATPLRFCGARANNECRTGSTSGDFFASIPGMTNQTSCWASQINLRIPCVQTGPVQATNAVQVLTSGADPDGVNQRLLGHLLMGPGHQYVYSSVLATPGAEYLIFGGYLTSGYHTALMMAKLPPYNSDSTSRNQFISVQVSGSCTSCYIRFGYQEFGDPIGSAQFYCTSRAEECRVAASAITPTAPFLYASEAPTPINGSFNIAIPALPGLTLFWQVVDSGVPGTMHSQIVN